MGAGTSALEKIESRGAGAPSGVGGLEHGPDPSAGAARLRVGGVRLLGAIAVGAFALIATARLTGNVRDRRITHKSLGPARSAAPEAAVPKPPQ